MPWIEMDDNDPGQLDMAIRAAIHLCWTRLPPPRQTLEEVESVFRHRVERALADLREDAEFFGPVVAAPEVSSIPVDLLGEASPAANGGGEPI